MSEFKEQMMMCSEDYNELIDMALAMKDKEWFEELVKRQKRLRELEVEMRRLLGVIDQDTERKTADQREPGEKKFSCRRTIKNTEPQENKRECTCSQGYTL